jgi:hypothetical protein
LRPTLLIPITALLAGAAYPALAWQAQPAPESNGTVGPAEIRDFSLPGNQPPPEREPEPRVGPATPPRLEPVEIPAPAAPTTAQPQPAPAEQRPVPARPAERPRAQASAPAEPALRQEERLPVPSDVQDALSPPQTVEVPANAVPETFDVAPAPERAPVTPPVGTPAEEEGFNWLWALLAALAGLAVLVAVLRSRKRAAEPEEIYVPVAEPAPVLEPVPAPVPEAAPAPVAVTPAAAPPVPQPAPQPEAAPSGHVGLVMRPWLELHFKPARATATDGGASVQYEAVIRNVGNAPARNVRLAARMFNAGPQLDAEVAHFYGLDIESPDGQPLTILPRSEVALTSVVSMPREEMREYKVEGRSLFIPTIAFNLLYEWGRGKLGQTSSAHVIGREPENPSAKMGPFRLDLGPRVYRQVGQRPSALARAV